MSSELLNRPLHPVGVIARYIALGAAVGVPVGLLWVVLAPRVLVEHSSPTAFLDAYPQGFAIADLTLGGLLLVAGVVIGVAAARRLRRTGFENGWTHIAGVVAATAVCAGVARVLGYWLAGRAMTADGPDLTLPLTLNADGVLLLALFSALLVIVLYATFAREPIMPAEEQSEPSSP